MASIGLLNLGKGAVSAHLLAVLNVCLEMRWFVLNPTWTLEKLRVFGEIAWRLAIQTGGRTDLSSKYIKLQMEFALRSNSLEGCHSRMAGSKLKLRRLSAFLSKTLRPSNACSI